MKKFYNRPLLIIIVSLILAIILLLLINAPKHEKEVVDNVGVKIGNAETLRDNPRFQDILGRINFPELGFEIETRK